MTATMRLFTIEARRSVALWFCPLIAMVACWYANDRLTSVGVVLWRHSSISIGESLIILAPLMGGVAAWAAGRDQRRGMGDLLAMTPRPISQRTLAEWSGMLIWGVVAYAIVGAYVVVMTVRDDAWGSPSAAPVIIGLLAIVAASAIGYLIGSVIPGRFVPPLVPIGLFLAIGLLNTDWFLDGPVSLLSPWTLVDRQLFLDSDQVFYAPPPLYPLPMTLWLSGLTGMALTGVVLASRREIPVWSALAGSMLVATAGATLLLSAYDDRYVDGAPWERGEAASYTPLCVERSVPVCVHPAFERYLSAHADRIDDLIQPVAGLPGAPVRVEQLPYTYGVLPDGTLATGPYGVEMAALALVQPPVAPEPGWNLHYDLQPEQIAVAIWLAQRVEDQAFFRWLLNGQLRDTQATEAAIYAAVDRFNALDPAEQRRWFDAHYADLRAGRLTLDDLP